MLYYIISIYYCVYTYIALCMPRNTESTHNIFCAYFLICLCYAYLYTYSQFVLCTRAVLWQVYTTLQDVLCGHNVILLYVVKLYKCSHLTGHSQVLRPVRASQSPLRWGLSCVGQLLCSVSCSAVLLFLWRSLLGTLSAMRHTRCIASHDIPAFLWTFHNLLSLMAEEWQGSG